MVNKRVQNAVLGCNLKNDRMISVRFQGKSFNITVIQAYAPTSNTEEAGIERFQGSHMCSEGCWSLLSSEAACLVSGQWGSQAQVKVKLLENPMDEGAW